MGEVFLPAEQESLGGGMSNHSSPVRSPTETDSPVLVKLSPLSLRSAAQAEREDIRRLKQECRGLSSVLKVSSLQYRYGNIDGNIDMAATLFGRLLLFFA